MKMAGGGVPRSLAPSGRTTADSRFAELDGLRGIAAVWVVLYHYTFGVQFLWPGAAAGQISRITPWTGNLRGDFAVDLFFVISGFVIFMTIEKCTTVFDFAASRCGRLYPAFWTAVVLTSLVVIAFPSEQRLTFMQIVANLTMVHQYLGFESVDGVYWTLTFEIGFYFMIAIVFAVGKIQSIEIIGAIWVVTSFVVYKLFPEFMIPWRIQFVTALPSASLFFAGILFFRIRSLGLTWQRAALLLLCYFVKIWGLGFIGIVLTTSVFSVFSLCVAGHGRLFACRPLVFLGTISYPLYLLHYAIGFRIQLLNAALGLPPAVNLFVTIAFAIGLATAVSFLVEHPGKKWVRRMYRSYTMERSLPKLPRVSA